MQEHWTMNPSHLMGDRSHLTCISQTFKCDINLPCAKPLSCEVYLLPQHSLSYPPVRYNPSAISTPSVLTSNVPVLLMVHSLVTCSEGIPSQPQKNES
jgi:hypothetical protein